MAVIRWRASVPALLGWNSLAFALSVSPLPSTGLSLVNSRGYNSCSGLSKYDFPALSRAPLTTPSHPWISCFTVPIFHFPLLRSSPLISTTSPRVKVVSFVLWLRLWRSQRALRYSVFHLVHGTSLHLRMYLARFLRLTSSIPIGSSSGIWLGCPYSVRLGVSTGNRTSSSTYSRGLLFTVVSTS